VADEGTDIHIEELKVAASSKLVDVTLKDSEIRNSYNLIFLSIVKGDGTMLFNPSPILVFVPVTQPSQSEVKTAW
jgi:voltage-gated potassium channel